MNKYAIMTTGGRTEDFRLLEPSWTQLVSGLAEPHRTSETVEEYKAMSKDEQSAVKDVGGYVGGRFRPGVTRRRGGAVVRRTLITIDIDTDTDFAPQCLYLRHTTHSSTAEARRWRYIIPLSREVDRTEYQAITRRIAEPIVDIIDPASFEPERLMFWPSASSDGEYLCEVTEGAILDADVILESYTDYSDPKEWSYAPTEVQKTYEHAGGKLSNPLEKPGVVGAWCREYDCRDVLDMFPDIYEPGNSYNRYTYKPGESSNGVVLYDGGLYCYSNHTTDPLHGKALNAFDLYRLLKFGDLDADASKFSRSDRLPSYTAMCKVVRADKKAGPRYLEENRPDLSMFDVVDNSGDAEVAAELQTNARGVTLGSLLNCVTILKQDALLSKNIKYDQFTESAIVVGDLPWERGNNTRAWGDTDDASLRVYLSKMYQVDASKDKIQDALDHVLMMSERQIHVVQEYIKATKWDCVDRVDTLFIRCLGADDTALNRAITRKALVACVKRVFEPGCKFDYMTILASEQGIGKSTLLARLGGKWFSDSFDFRQDGKNLMEQLDGNWIIESAELKGFSRQEITTIKAFLSKSDDRYRGAYKRHSTIKRRQCVFFGSTNEDAFLRDETGNRRFWVVPCRQARNTVSKDMLEIINDDGSLISQIWAEAYRRYTDGEPTELTAVQKEEMEETQKQYEYEDPLVAEAERYLSIRIPTSYYDWTKEQRKNYMQTMRLGASAKFGSYPALYGCNMVRRTIVCGEEFRYEWLSEVDCAVNPSTNLATRTLAKLEGWRKRPGQVTIREYGQCRVFERIDTDDTAVSSDEYSLTKNAAQVFDEDLPF